MLEYCFETQSLKKQYGNFHALDGVDMHVPKGSIYGFIGENGAGKTTLLRVCAGLTLSTSGEIRLLGATEPQAIHARRSAMGSLIERPALYPDLSAAQNLEIQRRQRGISGRDCIGRTLETVGLSHVGKKRAKHFSLGMRQRLALAMALLSEPELLLLDEPVNGLDPVGIVELREILLRLNREHGMTILISSHYLGELHQLATHYGILHKGRMLRELPASELDEACRHHLHIEVDDTQKASAVLKGILPSPELAVSPGGVLKLYSDWERAGELNTALVQGGVTVRRLTPMGDDLEAYYTKVIGGEVHA